MTVTYIKEQKAVKIKSAKEIHALLFLRAFHDKY